MSCSFRDTESRHHHFCKIRLCIFDIAPDYHRPYSWTQHTSCKFALLLPLLRSNSQPCCSCLCTGSPGEIVSTSILCADLVLFALVIACLASRRLAITCCFTLSFISTKFVSYYISGACNEGSP
eukprot:XP_001705639.1 High cysteine protein [Giardia lamblia ATCC 50803]